MAIATFHELCVDAVDAQRLGEFWGRVLDLDPEPVEGTGVRLTGRTPRHTVWINAVPEPVTVKQRVHLDVHARSTADVLALGAAALDTTSFRWDVLRDPEGGELCVFEREEVPADRLMEVVVDSVDPRAQAAWWAELLGARADGNAEEGWAWVAEIPGAPFESLVFVPVPEPKTVKNRIHLDLQADSVGALVAHGAQVLRRSDSEIHWTVLADPEGNELCLFTG